MGVPGEEWTNNHLSISLTALPSVYSEWRTEGMVRYNQWKRAIDAKKNNM